MENHIVSPENARQFWDWLKTRGGLAIWRSINLSNPGASWTAPLKDKKGEVKSKPTWQAGNEPERIITDPAEVEVVREKEVRRFHVAVRRTGPWGMTFKCTDASSRKVRAACDKAAEKYGEAWYRFDYGTQEAVILVPDGRDPLAEWIAQHGEEKSETQGLHAGAEGRV